MPKPAYSKKKPSYNKKSYDSKNNSFGKSNPLSQNNKKKREQPAISAMDAEIERELAHALPNKDYRELPPCAMLNPAPVVMVSCKGKKGEHARDNIVTVAWAGTICSEPPMVGIAIRPSRFSHEQIKQSGELVVNLVDKLHAEDCDFCGVKSGKDIDKWEARGLQKLPVLSLSGAVAIAGCPVYLACKVKQTLPLGSHDLFICEVVSVGAHPDLFDTKDKLCLDRANLVAYNHGDYVELGKTLGFFGYSVASEEVKKARLNPRPYHRAPKKRPLRNK